MNNDINQHPKNATSPLTSATKTAIFVVGFHRSGTSAFARFCNLLGAQMPTGAGLIAPDNPTGFWEPESIVAIHDQFLASSGLSWDTVDEMPQSAFDGPNGTAARGKLRYWLARELAGTDLLVLKDPRLCMLLPLWVPVVKDLNIRPVYLIPFRNPLETAQSLKQRNSLPISLGLALWSQYIVATERHTRQAPRVFVSYDALLQDWSRCAAMISRRLDLRWPVDFMVAQPRIDEFLSARLRHHEATWASLMQIPESNLWIQGLYRTLKRLENDPSLDVAGEIGEAAQNLKTLWLVTRQAQAYASGLKDQIQAANLAAEQLQRDHTTESAKLKDQIQAAKLDLQRTGIERDHLASIETQLRRQIYDFEHSRSWRYTRPLRQFRGAVRLKFSWILSLSRRSASVIRHQGLMAFFTRARGYLHNRWRYQWKRFPRAFSDQSMHVQKKESDPVIIASVIIPVYDRTDILRQAITSALNQTVGNIEVILVTDGSPPETVAVVNEFRRDPRVRVFNYPEKSGTAVRGRNKGILEARGKYIAFLDSDDIADPQRLEKSLPVLETGAADVVYGAWKAMLDGSRKMEDLLHDQVVVSPNCDLKMLLQVCVPCQSTVTVRKSLFDKVGLLKRHMRYREDHELWVRLAHYGARFQSIPEVLVQLRLHKGNNELNFKADDHQWAEALQAEYKLPGPKPKKIVFILPGVGISGGVAVVFKHALALMEAGHDVTIVNIGVEQKCDWFPDNSIPIVHGSDERDYLFDNIDLLFATGWSTVEWLERYRAKRKLYFVQSDERRFVDEYGLKQKIHNEYKTPCEYVTIARWLKAMLKDEFGHEAAYVPNGIDLKALYPGSPLSPKCGPRLRVLIEGPITIPFKGMADAHAAIATLDCDIWIVSSSGRPPPHWRYNRFFEAVPFTGMREIYASCDIFLKMSRIEGFGLPPLEAMACGCAVVIGRVEGCDEYAKNGYNAIVVDQGNIEAAKCAVQHLINDQALRQKLVTNGFQTARQWTWENATKAMLAVVVGPDADNDDSSGKRVDKVGSKM